MRTEKVTSISNRQGGDTHSSSEIKNFEFLSSADIQEASLHVEPSRQH